MNWASGSFVPQTRRPPTLGSAVLRQSQADSDPQAKRRGTAKQPSLLEPRVAPHSKPTYLALRPPSLDHSQRPLICLWSARVFFLSLSSTAAPLSKQSNPDHEHWPLHNPHCFFHNVVFPLLFYGYHPPPQTVFSPATHIKKSAWLVYLPSPWAAACYHKFHANSDFLHILLLIWLWALNEEENMCGMWLCVCKFVFIRWIIDVICKKLTKDPKHGCEVWKKNTRIQELMRCETLTSCNLGFPFVAKSALW